MAVTGKSKVTQLTTTAITAIHTAGTATKVNSLVIYNGHTSAVTVEIYDCKVGAAGSASNRLYKKSLTPDETLTWDNYGTMENTDVIRVAAAVASVVNVKINYTEVS